MLYNIENEQMVLCQLLIKPEEINRVRDIIKPHMFYINSHKTIYEVMLSLYDNGFLPSIIEVVRELNAINKELVPLATKISSLTYTAANIDYYITSVKDCYIKRELQAMVDDVKNALYNQSYDASDAVSTMEKRITALSLASSGAPYRRSKDIIIDLAEKLDQMYSNKAEPEYISMPYEDLAKYFDFVKGEYCIVAARPGIGKTTFAVSLIYLLSVVNKVPTGIFSVEMSAQQLALRFIAQSCSLSPFGILRGFYASKEQKERMLTAMYEVGNAPIVIDDTSSIKLSSLVSKARSMVTRDKCEIIFVDYIGLVDAENHRIPRHEQIAEISRTMKSLAKELHIPIVVFSQLTRDYEGKRPTLNSLAETRSLEQDADVVVFLHRERAIDAPEQAVIDTEVIVAKNRNGPVGTAMLAFLPKISKFVEKHDNTYGL